MAPVQLLGWVSLIWSFGWHSRKCYFQQMSPWLHWSLWQCSERLRHTPVLVKLIMFNARSTLLNIPFTLDRMLCFRTDWLHWEENNPGVFSPSGMWESIYTLAIPLINVWKWFLGKCWLCLAEPSLFGHLTVPPSANHVPFLLHSGWW